jgi:hypothetical protein
VSSPRCRLGIEDARLSWHYLKNVRIPAKKTPLAFSVRKPPPIAESSGVQQQLASAKRKRIMFRTPRILSFAGYRRKRSVTRTANDVRIGVLTKERTN